MHPVKVIFSGDDWMEAGDIIGEAKTLDEARHLAEREGYVPHRTDMDELCTSQEDEADHWAICVAPK